MAKTSFHSQRLEPVTITVPGEVRRSASDAMIDAALAIEARCGELRRGFSGRDPLEKIARELRRLAAELA